MITNIYFIDSFISSDDVFLTGEFGLSAAFKRIDHLFQENYDYELTTNNSLIVDEKIR